ncbi:MAG: histidinol-phosphate transaminase [Syntrophomonadaceae bacterium]|nr:histidinol-phosphate transaminase [Syntrophomonadaceae bacterium]
MTDFVKDKARPEIFTLKPYVPGKPIDEVKRELGLKDVVKMASNENPLGSSPQAIAAVRKSLELMYLYPDSHCYELKQRLAEITGVNENSILIGNGSDEVLMLLATAFINRGDQIILAQPTFAEYEFTAKIMGGECIEVPLVEFTHDLEGALAAITDKTKMVIICNPNNPTGTIVGAAAIARFMERVPEDVLVVFDEAYSEYAESPDFVSGLQYVRAGRNAIVLHTFSKIYGLAALRVGYALTLPEIAQALEMIMEPFNVNLLGQIGARAALDDLEHVERSRAVNSAGKKYLYGELENMGLFYVPTEANFIFLDTGRNSREVFQAMLRLGVIIRTGDNFGHPTFIRVTVGKPAENERFIASLRQVLAI